MVTKIAEATLRARVVITGRVQGVNFRWYTRRQAQELKLVGGVRNLEDGRVEALFEGAEEAVRQMVSWCHAGSPSAQVDGVQVTYERATGELSGFHIR